MKCLQASKMISLSQERDLTLKEKTALYSHLIICPQCRNFNKNCQALRQMMKTFAKREDE